MATVKITYMTDEINELFTLSKGGHQPPRSLHAVFSLLCHSGASVMAMELNPTKATPPNITVTENPPFSFQHHRSARDEAAHLFRVARMEYETKTRKNPCVGRIRMCWLLTGSQPPT